MTSIPYSVLISKDPKIIHPEEIQEHQKFCKSFHKLYTFYEKRKENNSKNFDTEFSTQSKEKILNWFENLPLNQKIKICTIKNQWLAKIFIQLYIICQTYDSSFFKPISDMKMFFAPLEKTGTTNFKGLNNYLLNSYCPNNEEYDQNKCNKFVEDLNFYENFFSLFEESSYNYNYFSKEETKRKDAEKNFLDKIKFLSLGSNNINIITLSKDFLENFEQIKYFLNYFSNKQCFSDWLIPITIHNNIYNFLLPNWLNGNNLTL